MPFGGIVRIAASEARQWVECPFRGHRHDNSKRQYLPRLIAGKERSAS
jgi:hypothetical protein